MLILSKQILASFHAEATLGFLVGFCSLVPFSASPRFGHREWVINLEVKVFANWDILCLSRSAGLWSSTASWSYTRSHVSYPTSYWLGRGSSSGCCVLLAFQESCVPVWAFTFTFILTSPHWPSVSLSVRFEYWILSGCSLASGACELSPSWPLNPFALTAILQTALEAPPTATLLPALAPN